MIVAIVFGLITVFAAQDRVASPQHIPRDRGTTIVTTGGKEVWTAQWSMEPSTEKGRPAVHFTETGRGRLSAYPLPVSWTLDAVWLADERFYPIRFEKTITDNSGRTIATERKTFDDRKGVVQFELKRAGQSSESKQLPAPPDTLAIEGVAGILRYLPFDHWRSFRVHLLTNEPQLYRMKIEMRGKERVKTPAGEFDCFKIELVPQLGALGVFRSLLPKTFFWFSAAAPHFWVRYEGPESGRGSPQIVMELKSYEPER